MKRLFIIPLALSVLALPGMALAESSSTGTSTRGEVRKEVKQELKDDRKDIKEDAKAFRADRARANVTATTNVMLNTVSRLENIESRLETRLNSIQITSTSTASTSPSALLSMSKSELENARAHIAIIKSIDLSGSTTTARANFENVKKEAKVVMQSLRDARMHMLQAVHAVQKWEKVHKEDNND